jgi:beta-galactosidase
VRSGPRPHFWRAPTDNDKGHQLPERGAGWKAASDNWVVDEAVVEVIAPAVVAVRFSGSLPDVGATHEVAYTVHGNGEVRIESRFEPGDAEVSELPRFGMQMTLPDDFNTITWYGRGPHESYWDRKAGAAVGVYSGSVDEQYFEYSEPQETGNKTDVRWVSLTNDDGVGLQAVGLPLLSVNALRYTTDDIEQAKHLYEMTRRDFVTLNIDFQQAGVGGDDSWGARPHPQYTLTPQPYSYAFKLRSIQGGGQ